MLDEGGCDIAGALLQREDQFGLRPPGSRDRFWSLRKTLVTLGKIRTQWWIAANESIAKGLGDGMAFDRWTKTSDGGQERYALEKDGEQKQSENGRPMLTLGDAEVRQQRNGAARHRTQQPANSNPHIYLGVRKQRVPFVPTVEPERVVVETNKRGTPMGLEDEKKQWRCTGY